MVGRRTEIIGPCGSSSGGGLATNNCCSTIYQAGSVDLDGLEWATDYTITLASPIGTVTVTDQGSGTWTSDVVEVTCTVDEVTVTDEYTVTMTATGNAPGEVIVTVALTLGAGYGGASGCCDTTSTGFAWKFVNCCIVDPLAGWSMTRDPSGFSGRECEIGGCEICVTPSGVGSIANTCDDRWYNPSTPNFTTSTTAPAADSYRVWEKDAKFFNQYKIVASFGTINMDSDCFIWNVGTPNKSFTVDSCSLPLVRSVLAARPADIIEYSSPFKWTQTGYASQLDTCSYAEVTNVCDPIATQPTKHRKTTVRWSNGNITFEPCVGDSTKIGQLTYNLELYFAVECWDGSLWQDVVDTYKYTGVFQVSSTASPAAATINPTLPFALQKVSESFGPDPGDDNFSWTDGIIITSLQMIPVI